MKLVTLIFFILLGFSQFSLSQDLIETPKNNSMSNVFGLTVEAGATLGLSDYNSNKINYTAKGSLEYYLPSTGSGNFGLRLFGQTGFISGKDAPLGAENPTNEFATRIDAIGGGIFYTLSLGDVVYPWLGVGASNLWFYPEDANGNKLPNAAAEKFNTSMIGYNGDAGVRFMVSKSISINIMGGIIVGSEDFLDDIEIGSNNDMLYTGTAGLSYYFGREKDSDGDGVRDSEDACADTPLEAKVDEVGCPLDSDGDGIPDYLDKCANTLTGVKVDAYGCPLDTDGDGVPDYLDKCANTLVGVKVDAKGCPLDTDGDGVPDYLDKCPNTPKGIEVDSKGCTIEKDTVIIIQPTEVESLVLSGDTNFEFNKSALLPSAYTALEGVVNTMTEHSGYKWEVGGYTDAIGSDNYNIKLSQQRAQSVVDYLVSKGVERNNLTIVGYGEANPVATNDTDEGRSMNRRVEIKILSKDSK